MNRWKTQRVKFALIGSSAVGKSTYINTVRGVKYGMNGWAEEGVLDTTTEIKEYKHPENKQIAFFDIPGYSLKLPKAELLKKIEPIDQFDYFLVFFEKGLGEDELAMIEVIQNLWKPFCLVRTKLDEDIMHGARRNKDPETIKSEIRDKVRISLQSNKLLKEMDPFLISCVDTNIGDFPDLWEHMKQHLSKAKYEAIMLTLPILTKHDIDKKFDELKNRTKFVAVAAGLVSAIPLPSVDIPINMSIIKREIRIYTEAFHLNRKEVANIPGRKLNFLSLSFGQFVQSGLRSIMNIGVIGAASQFDAVVPVFGSVIAYGATSQLIEQYLLQTLTDMKAEAIHIFNFMCNREMFKT